ncbi:MAG: PulJ/GspJ family protein [Planctomycetota bacterium]
MRSPRTAMTLVEILVATGIAVLLLAIAGFAQYNIGRSIERSQAIAGLYAHMAAVNDRLQTDFAAYMPAGAMQVVLGDEQRITFLKGYSIEAEAQRRSHSERLAEAFWVSWEYTPGGGLRRSESPPLTAMAHADAMGGGNSPPFYIATPNNKPHGWQVKNAWNNLNATPLYGRASIPQRRIRYLLNHGDPGRPDVPDPAAQYAAWLWDWQAPDTYPIPLRNGHGGLSGEWQIIDPYAPFNGLNAGRHYLMGNTNLIPGAYGASLPPPNDPAGIPQGEPVFHHADALHLVGADTDRGRTFYPGGYKRISSHIELFDMRITTIGDESLQAPASGSLVRSIVGTRMDQRHLVIDDLPQAPAGIRAGLPSDATVAEIRQAHRGHLPRYLTVTYVIHDMDEVPGRPVIENPAAPDFNEADPSSINYLRHQFFDEVQPTIAPEDRHVTMQRMIEAMGHTALVIEQSFRLL